MRFMRIGVDVESITDAHLLTMNSVRIHEDCLVIGISISGTTKEVITALERAKEKGAVTILVTSKNSNEYVSKFDEVILASVKKNLEYGNVISPQFPILIIMDIIYANYIQEDRNRRQAIYDVTLNDFLDR
jgi:DNA-binding MurR/RpiR family transcriptional regulator